MPLEPMVRSAGAQDVPANGDMNGANQAGPPPAGELVGHVLRGTYRILEVLDEGGMGRLYRAEHIRLHRPIAVKVLAHHLATDQAALTRFHREAEIVSQLHHPHIVHILDFDTTDVGAPYIVMELLHGESLAKRLNRERMLAVSEVVEIVVQIASALNLAHQQGIVHRDLKPDNVFLLDVDAGQVFIKLLDFGISKSTSTATKVTREFDVLGTPDYMAPEQAISTSRADHRADQFALASMTYEMITGRMPFIADSIVELLHKVVHEEPLPASVYAPGLGAMVDKVLMRAMAKSPEARFSSVQDFAYALAQATGIPLHSGPPPQPNSLTPQSPPVSNPPVMASLPHFQDSSEPELARDATNYQHNLPTPELPKERTPNAAPQRQPRGSDESPAARQPARPMLRSHSSEDRPIGESARPAVRSSSDQGPHTLRSSGGPTKKDPADYLAELHGAIAEVRRAVAFGEQQRALNQARRAVHLARACNEREARSALVEASRLLELVLLPPLGGVQKKVSLRNACPSSQGDWTPGHFFLLSRLEQPSTIEELLDLSPLSRPETLCFIADLLAQEIVSVS
jgi:eukaryotic-like serine/threonine-protein kinase